MKIHKLLATVLCAFALAACGGSDGEDSSSGVQDSDSNSGGSGDSSGGGDSGGGGDNSTGGGGQGAEATHLYFSVDFEDFQTPRSVVIDHDKTSATITLGNDMISYTTNGDDEVFASGYTVLGEMDGPDGELMVCSNTSSLSTDSRHFILPATAVRVTDLTELQGKAFDVYEDCEQTGEFTFDASGALSWQDSYGGEDASGTETPATVSAWFSDSGWSWTDGGEQGKDYAQLYREPGSGALYIVNLMSTNITATSISRDLAVGVLR